LLFSYEVGRVVSADGENSSVGKGCAQSGSVVLALHGRITLDAGTKRSVIGVSKYEVGHAHFSRDIGAVGVEKLEFVGGSEVRHVQLRAIFAGKVNRQLC
jgi:hypothetical protein